MEVSTDVGDRVAFAINSAFLPSPEEVASAFAIGVVVEGTLVEFSDAGQHARFFAVVEVVRQQRIVVPVEELVLQQHVMEPPITEADWERRA